MSDTQIVSAIGALLACIVGGVYGWRAPPLPPVRAILRWRDRRRSRR